MRYYWLYGRLPSQVMNPEVSDALARTHGDFAAIFNHYPPGRVSEKEKLRFAEETALMVRDNILPEYENLVKLAIAKLAEAIKDGQIQIKEKKCAPEDLSPDEIEEEARKLLRVQRQGAGGQVITEDGKAVRKENRGIQKGNP